MDLGLLVFVGIFVLAGVGIGLQVIRRRALRARLLTLGFERCEEQAPVLRQALLDVAGGLGPAIRRDYRVANCFRRAAGFGMVHRFTTLDVTNADPQRRAMGGRFEAYLIDLRDPQRIARRPVAVYVSPSGSRVLRGLFGKLIELDAPGVPLTITPTPENGSLAAAFGEATGKLDEVLPPEIQVRLSRAGSAGFFAAHFNAGRVALFVIPDTRDLDRQWTHVAEWL